MKLIAVLATVATFVVVSSASAAGWTTSAAFSNQVASSPTSAWG
jgi:hypothetical protein